ncbi:MAG: hypothetical protein OXP09_08395 [Gammaproteobacteria bacterium]|nr:hypothetical protein [Gammaproteobacteria bacterium]
MNPNVTWVNPIDKVSVAEHKLYQLRTASRLGLQIPKTLVSSDVNELRSFASEMKSGTICKPIFHGLFFDGEAYNAIYCRRLDVSSLHHDNLRHCPIMVQQEIPRIADVRATFIGPHCFVADIVGDTDLLDWRNPDLVIDYTKSKLDTKTTTRCRKLMAELGLVYGAFDFIRKTSGELVFLEINPTGEWAWLEEKLNFPMREAFIDVFYGGKT